jgi:hypothetical protein
MAADDTAPERYIRTPGVDLYVGWALGPGRERFFLPQQREWMPVLVRLEGISAAEFASGRPFLADDALTDWSSAVQVAPLFTQARTAPGPVSYCTALVTSRFFDMLSANERLRSFVPRVTLGLPMDRTPNQLPAQVPIEGRR